MAGLCEGGNEPASSLKSTCMCRREFFSTPPILHHMLDEVQKQKKLKPQVLFPEDNSEETADKPKNVLVLMIMMMKMLFQL
ncbi:hypothetical protein ANN_12941 [Periplaneta americana]|uniref:Uncharacterized protein n=1 Tax=Periplaneta americana TaxID=6978 RepID=A0ABQ8TIH8_PERAM|nr:hypothetical protein ANN_12941 [Periplaneta americana]